MRTRLMNPKVTVSVVFVLAMFMAIMDTTIVNVALPTISRDLSVPLDRVDGVVVGFLVSLAVFIPASGWLGDRFGTKRVFLTALVIFTLASALCGLAQNFGELVGFRVLQGVGGGMLTPTGMAMLYRTFPPAERVRASRILTVPTALAPALGPVVGGILVTAASWRWVFYVNLPIGVLGFVFGVVFLQEHREAGAGRFDLPGFLLAGTGLGGLMYALSEGPSHGWGSPLIISLGLAGIVLLTALVLVEMRTAQPMIHLRLLADRLFASTTAVLFIGVMAFLGSLYLIALFLQEGLGLSALNAGLSTFPEALGVMLGAQIAARVYPRAGPRRMMTAGMLGVAATTALMATVGSGTSLWWLRALMFLFGLCWAQALVPLQAAAFATITPAATGAASTLFNTGRQLGMAVGVAILSTVASAVGLTQVVAGRAVPHLAAYHAGLVTASVIALIAAGAAQFVDDRAAAATMRGPQPHRRSTATGAHAVSAGCHHPAAAGRPPERSPGGAERRLVSANRKTQRGLEEASRHESPERVTPAHQAGSEAGHTGE
jgi:EmrB/QacA subfamily drug resistance transporter